MLPLQLLGASVQLWKEMRFSEHFTNLGKRGAFQGLKECAESSCWFLWWAGGELGKGWRSGWTGVKAFRPLGALLRAKMLNSAALRLASLLKNEHVYSFPHPKSSFSLAPGRKHSLFLMSVIGELIPLQLIFMCWDSFCLFFGVYGVPNKGLKLRGHRKEPNFLVEGTSTSYHFSSLYMSIEMLPEKTQICSLDKKKVQALKIVLPYTS